MVTINLYVLRSKNQPKWVLILRVFNLTFKVNDALSSFERQYNDSLAYILKKNPVIIVI